VVAIMIVVIRFEGMLEIKAGPGVGLFAAAILLSIVAGSLVHLRKEDHG
jgi:uncharacterized paraquat-inducible protein A